MPANIDLILKRQKEFEGERTTWDSHWQEVADYMVPRRAEFTTRPTRGGKRRGQLYDSTAVRANRILAAGMHGQMTSPAAPWFSLKTKDPDLMKDEEVKRWLLMATRTILDVLNASNFNSSIHEDYLDLGPFGTSCLYEADDPDDIVYFDCRPLTEIYIGENFKKQVDIVHRKFVMKARQAKEEFGDACGEAVKKALEKKKTEDEFEFIHAVFPRNSFDPEKFDNLSMPFASVYAELSKKEQVGEESGYIEMPYMVDRWLKSSSEVYGRGPGIEALPDSKMVNTMAKTIIKAAQKMVDPPLIVPAAGGRGFIMPFLTNPGSLIFKNSMDPNAKLDQLETKGNIPIGLEMKKERREMIREAFFVDLFLMLAEKPKMTATEVLERVEEKMIVLGPVLGRLMNELLDPIVKRTFRIVLQKGFLGPVPARLDDQEYEIEYVSPLARAQKLWQLNAVTRWMGIIAPLAEAKPQLLDWINDDGAVTYLSELLGVAPEFQNTEKQVQEIRAMRAKAQQEQQVMAELLQLSEIMKKSGLSLSALAPGGGGGQQRATA